MQTKFTNISFMNQDKTAMNLIIASLFLEILVQL